MVHSPACLVKPPRRGMSDDTLVELNNHHHIFRRDGLENWLGTTSDDFSSLRGVPLESRLPLDPQAGVKDR